MFTAELLEPAGVRLWTWRVELRRRKRDFFSFLPYSALFPKIFKAWLEQDKTGKDMMEVASGGTWREISSSNSYRAVMRKRVKII